EIALAELPPRSVTDEKPTLDDHAHELLGIKWVPVGACEERLTELVGHAGLAQEQRDELRRLVACQRRQCRRERVRVAAPARPSLLELGPRSAEEDERRIAAPVGDVLDEVEQRVVGPVEVLEQQDERCAFRQRLEVASPSRERLVASVARLAA